MCLTRGRYDFTYLRASSTAFFLTGSLRKKRSVRRMAPTLRLRAASTSPPRPTMNSVLPPPMSITSTCWSKTGTAWSTPRWMSRASSTPEITSTPTLALTRAASRKSSRFSASRTALVATAWTSAPNVSAMRRNRPRAATPRSMASAWSSFMSPDPDPSRTTSLSRARISKRLLPVGRATTRWKLLVPMSIAATGVVAWGACDTTCGGYPASPSVTSPEQSTRFAIAWSSPSQPVKWSWSSPGSLLTHPSGGSARCSSIWSTGSGSRQKAGRTSTTL